MNIHFLNKNTLCILRSLTQDIHEKVEKGRCMLSEGKTCHQKNHRRFRKINYLEGSVQKGDPQEDISHEVLHPQSFFCTIQGSVSKVKCDITRS